MLSHPLPDCYCPLIVEPPPAPLAPPYRGARKVRRPKFYARSSHQKNYLNNDRRHIADQVVKLSYASIGFMECEDEEVDVIEEEEKEEEVEEMEEVDEEEEDEEEEEEEEDMSNADEGRGEEAVGEAKRKRKKKTRKLKKKKTREKNQDGDARSVSYNRKDYDNEEEFEVEELDHYGESDELLEEFQMMQRQLRDHTQMSRQKVDKQSPYQNQRLTSSWKWRQRERESRCRTVLEATEELDEADDSDNRDEEYEKENGEDKLVYGDVEETDESDDAKCHKNGEQRYLPENHSLLSTWCPSVELGSYSATDVVVEVGRRQMIGSNWREVLSVTEMKHATSLPSVHYQNCNNGNPVVKQKLRGVFSLT